MIDFFITLVVVIVIAISEFFFNGNPPNLWFADNKYKTETTVEPNYETKNENLSPKPIEISITSTPTVTTVLKKFEELETYLRNKYHSKSHNSILQDYFYIVDLSPYENPKQLILKDKITNTYQHINLLSSTSANLDLPNVSFSDNIVIDQIGEHVLYTKVNPENCTNSLFLYNILARENRLLFTEKYDLPYTSECSSQSRILISHLAISPDGKRAVYWRAQGFNTGAGYKADLYHINLDTGEKQILYDATFLHDGQETISSAAYTVWVDNQTINFWGYVAGGYTGEWSINVDTKEIKKILDFGY